MAMRTPSAWWLSALFVAGLLFVFVGQRPLSQTDALGPALTVLGTALALGAAAVRGWVVYRAKGAGRRTEAVLLATELGALAALATYALTGARATDAIDFASQEAESTYLAAMRAGYAILFGLALIPKLVVEIGLGVARRGRFARPADLDGAGASQSVELPKVRELAWSGLTIALAGAFLMVSCHVASERNARVDVSYFKTSSPGESTISMAESVGEPIEVLLFFPEVNRVKSEVRGYFNDLERQTGNVRVEEHDRMVSADLAREHNVTEDGTILVVYQGRNERIRVSSEFEQARRDDLRTLDGDVQEALMRVIREPRVAYFTVGHGELNDPDTRAVLGAEEPGLTVELLRQRLTMLNYEVRDLGMTEGLARGVPDDATIVFSLMPHSELLPEAQATLVRYLEDGGRLFMALDPRGEADLGALGERLGVRFRDTPLADDDMFIPQRRNDSDHRLVVTNQFSSHAAVSTLAQAGPRAEVVLNSSGYLENAEQADPASRLDRTYLIETLPSAFADETGDFVFDEALEERDSYDVAVAVEGELSPPGEAREAGGEAPGDGDDGDDSDGDDSDDSDGDDSDDRRQHGDDDGESREMRALVFADGDMVSDALVAQVPAHRILIDDAIRWLGGEEEFAGAVESEEDDYIQHTRSEDVFWFYSTIVGAPVLVLGFGLTWVYLRRRLLTGRPS